jgi:hypothetical protein
MKRRHQPLFDSELSGLVCSVLDYKADDGYEKLEFDFGENARETAIISKDGSRCENYSIIYVFWMEIVKKK